MSAMDETGPIDSKRDEAGGGLVASIAFGIALLILGFVAGSFAMYREVFPATALRHAYQGGLALYDKLTRYQDPIETDLWRPARTDAKGVTIYDRERAQTGLTLYSSGDSQRALLIDMEGHVVHEWDLAFSSIWDDSAAVKEPQPDSYIYIEKAHVLPNGDLLALYVAVGDTPWGYGLVRMDKNSKVLWKYLAHAHHDFDIDHDGNVFVLTQEISNDPIPGHDYLRPPRIDDFVVKLSPDGRELEKLWLTGAVARSPAGRRLNLVPWYAREGSGDYLHTNAVEVLRRPLSGVAETQAGQLLLSFREISSIGVVDLERGDLVWSTTGPWMRQHDADELPNGDILLFDNEGNVGEGGASRVIEINPGTHEVVWSYSGTKNAPFESIVRSSQIRLSNGNTLIVESDAGRIIEVTSEGDIVWEFVNPVRGGPKNERIPIIFWVQRLDPASFDPDFARTLVRG